MPWQPHTLVSSPEPHVVAGRSAGASVSGQILCPVSALPIPTPGDREPLRLSHCYSSGVCSLLTCSGDMTVCSKQLHCNSPKRVPTYANTNLDKSSRAATCPANGVQFIRSVHLC